MRRRTLVTNFPLLAAPFLAVGTPGRAVAQKPTYPSRSIRLVIPWPPGQATDLAGRVLAQRLSEQLGQTVVADNRAGAGGMIGTDNVAKAAPDGYTLLAGSAGPVTISPLVQRTSYDVERDFVPVAMMRNSPYVLVVRRAFPATDMQQFLKLARAEPNKYSFASSGTGATAHLIGEMFNRAAGLQALHVPFSGSAASVTAVAAGQVDYATETLAAVNPLIRSGELRPLGISLAHGSVLAPDIPPIQSAAGIARFDAGAWLGLLAPIGTPPAIVDRLAQEVSRAMSDPAVRERCASIGVEPDFRDPEAFAKHLREQKLLFAELIRSANIHVD